MTDAEPIDLGRLRHFPLPHVPEDAGKEERGRLLVIAGSRELAGAALLAGVAALRAGAGKLQIATAASIARLLSVAIPEARVIGYPETDQGGISEDAIAPLAGWAEAAQAVTIGCGLQHGPTLQILLAQLLALERPLVLDAAVLDCLPPLEVALRARTHGSLLLPHQGEMARLLDQEVEEIAADPIAAVRTASEQYNAVALVKGRFSYIADPGGRVFQIEGGGVGMATSGSGDVLAGLVGGLCARGADPLAAMLWGVWLHAEAGRLLTQRVGRIGFLARELSDLVPGLLPQ